MNTMDNNNYTESVRKYYEMIIKVLNTVYHPGDSEKSIAKILGMTGEFINASRVYIFEIYDEEGTTSNTYEWCAEGITPQIDELQNIPESGFDEWWRIMREDTIFVADDIKTLPPFMYEFFKYQHIYSIITLPLYIDNNMVGFIGFDECKRYRSWSNHEIEILRALSTLVENLLVARNAKRKEVATQRFMAKKSLELIEMKEHMLEMLAALIEFRDLESGYHVKRTKFLVDQLINEMLNIPRFFTELHELDYEKIINAAPMHDIGKIAIPDSILLKPGKLTESEFEIVKKHTTIGAEIMDRILGGFDDVYYRHCREICLYHHERWDGTGYPTGRKGKDIPLSARIISVTDVYDALVSKRPYKEPFDHDVALKIIKDGSGTQFDPDIVNAFLRLESWEI